ncbi:MAG: hypothetical protein ACXU9L_08780 [Thermodesulfobacteriota bacterium]
MERKGIICLFLFVVFVLVLSSCHPRHVSDIKANMTKEEVVSLWGKTPLITSKTVDGKTIETWEYHFSSSNSACSITFSQERVVSTQCRPLQRQGYGYYYSPPGQGRPEAPPAQRKLVREGFFAVKLAEALKVGEVKSEAEAESKLASVGVFPKNGWIADYPLTPKVITELENAIGEAADEGKLAMKRDEALKVYRDLIANVENEYAQVEPDQEEQPYSESYVYPRFNYYPYYYSYPYYFGYYPFHYPYFRRWR